MGNPRCFKRPISQFLYYNKDPPSQYKNIIYLQRLNHNDYFKAITLKAKLKNGINYSINSIIKLE